MSIVRRVAISEHTSLTDTNLNTGEKTPHVRVVNKSAVLVDDLLEWIDQYPDRSLRDLQAEIAPNGNAGTGS